MCVCECVYVSVCFLLSRGFPVLGLEPWTSLALSSPSPAGGPGVALTVGLLYLSAQGCELLLPSCQGAYGHLPLEEALGR